MSESRRRGLCSVSVFLVLLGIYLLTNPGRIDSIDGQYRWEISKNWIDSGEPSVQDPRLYFWAHQDHNTGKWYSNYNAAASVTPMPLMAISRLLPGDREYERDRFAFALTGGFFGAALGAVLVIAFGMLGLGTSASVAWALVFGLTTLWWPASVTVLDQNQHTLVAFVSLLIAWQSGRRKSFRLAALGGLVGGLLFAYQENYALLLPMIALAVFASPDEAAPDREPSLRRPLEWSAFLRYLTYGLCSATGLLLFFGYNYLRYSALVRPNRYTYESGTASAAITWGDPLAAVVSLLASPGKGVLFFSPPLILALFGARGLFKRAPVLLSAIIATSLVHVAVVSQLAFFSGDWCWGPRYLVILLPMWALTLPFAAQYLPRPRFVVGLVVSLGLLVQVMAITFDYHRFFFERNLDTFFYVNNQWVYFKESQLIARPFEIYATLHDGIPPEARYFAPTPDGKLTYTPSGAFPGLEPRVWMRYFAVWYAPWPWPLWIWMVDPADRPVNPWVVIVPCVALVAVGSTMLVRLTRRSLDSPIDEPVAVLPT
jgi:hypothetical protein